MPEPKASLPPGVSAQLQQITVPSDRVPTRSQIDLGEKVIRDKRLSSDGTTSCATCHDRDNADERAGKGLLDAAGLYA